MAKMGVAEMMAVLQAYATGGYEIQFRDAGSVNDNMWTTTDHPAFNFHSFEYRVKPRPKEFLILVDCHGQVVGGANSTSTPGQFVMFRDGTSIEAVTVVKVKEVL